MAEGGIKRTGERRNMVLAERKGGGQGQIGGHCENKCYTSKVRPWKKIKKSTKGPLACPLEEKEERGDLKRAVYMLSSF